LFIVAISRFFRLNDYRPLYGRVRPALSANDFWYTGEWMQTGLRCRIWRRLTFAVALLAALVSAGCATTPAGSGAPLPDEARLQARLREFHEAMGRNEIEKVYALSSPTIRKQMTFTDFKKDMRWDKVGGRSPVLEMQAGLGKNCGCTDMGGFQRCVLIVNVAVSGAGRSSATERPLEMWEHVDGDWYWGYSGPDSRGRCPGM
jgi:hypothetical protein